MFVTHFRVNRRIKFYHLPLEPPPEDLPPPKEDDEREEKERELDEPAKAAEVFFVQSLRGVVTRRTL